MSNGLELLTTTEMAEADRLAAASGIPSLTLMENAGRAVAEEAMRMLPANARVIVLCGPGNNGGDGFVAARLLRERGCDVRLACLVPLDRLRGDAAEMARRWTGEVATRLPDGPADLVVDAIFGAGLSRPPDGVSRAWIEEVNRGHASRDAVPALAVDVPSGLDGSTGIAPGAVVRATRTVTFFRRKPGHLLLPGRVLCGDVALYDIGIDRNVLGRIGPKTWSNAQALWEKSFPRLRLDGHKYTRGHAVVCSGNIEMSGAARLCARGALRIGAGLVTVASPPDALQAHAAQLNATLLKAASTPDELATLLADARFTAAAIGPGLGRAGDALPRVMALLAAATAVVLDADALTVASARPDDLFRAIHARPPAHGPVVLTPHEGEFKRLFPDLAGSKLARARAAAARAGAVVVLKGPDTVISAPDGRAAINENAPPTLATAGSGDVLAGFVAGLLAQAMPAFEAASAAVWLHGECATAHGPGLIAEDLPELLPQVLARLLPA